MFWCRRHSSDVSHFVGTTFPGAFCTHCTDYRVVSLFRLARNIFGYEDDCDCEDRQSYYVGADRLPKAQILVVQPTGDAPGESAPPGTQGIGPASQLRVTSTGCIAWIVRNRYSPSHEVEVWGATPTRARQQFAHAADISVTSLSLDNHRVRWFEAGQYRFAAFC